MSRRSCFLGVLLGFDQGLRRVKLGLIDRDEAEKMKMYTTGVTIKHFNIASVVVTIYRRKRLVAETRLYRFSPANVCGTRAKLLWHFCHRSIDYFVGNDRETILQKFLDCVAR